MPNAAHESSGAKPAPDYLTPEQAYALTSPYILQTLLRDMPDLQANNRTYRNPEGNVYILIQRARIGTLDEDVPSSLVTAIDKRAKDLSSEGLDSLMDIPETALQAETYKPFKSDWATQALRDILILTPDQLSELEIPSDDYYVEEYRIQGNTSVI